MGDFVPARRLADSPHEGNLVVPVLLGVQVRRVCELPESCERALTFMLETCFAMSSCVVFFDRSTAVPLATV